MFIMVLRRFPLPIFEPRAKETAAKSARNIRASIEERRRKGFLLDVVISIAICGCEYTYLLQNYVYLAVINNTETNHLMRKGVVVIGSSNLDITARVKRLPRPGETIGGGHLLTANGGKGANQAVAAARMGADVLLLTCLGRDASG